ncbi:lamin tail domain-containing protein [Streptomyces sp. NPDC001027]|uniref:lamin tail domain-containing protein n=1 Tax=Streptomyces sp. NPDC001027 TaxID=3154771 RepID=UPI00332F231B
MSASASVTARRLAAAALAAGALVSVAALPASAADHRPARERVEISAVQADSPGPDDRSNRSLNREWVELTNTTRHTVNLDGWTLEDASGKTYTFDDYRLAGRATVRIHTGVGRDTRTDLYQDRRAYVWSNDHDTATLRNDDGRIVDEESWGHRRHHGRSADEESWGHRRHDGRSGDEGSRDDRRHHGGDRRHHQGGDFRR